MTNPKDWPKNRELWTTALRDPKRRQIKKMLGHQDHGGQCCLGVLAEIAGCTYRRSGFLWDCYCGEAPQLAMDFVGLRTSDGEYLRTSDGEYLNSSLTHDNDHRGKTFAEIADIIEEEPEGLFRA